MDLQMLKAIIEALRNPANHPTPGVERSPGFLRRTTGGNPMGGVNSDVNYDRYRKIQSGAGESPVSYEEWMQSQ